MVAEFMVRPACPNAGTRPLVVCDAINMVAEFMVRPACPHAGTRPLVLCDVIDMVTEFIVRRLTSMSLPMTDKAFGNLERIYIANR
jgi:hypothetical protein